MVAILILFCVGVVAARRRDSRSSGNAALVALYHYQQEDGRDEDNCGVSPIAERLAINDAWSDMTAAVPSSNHFYPVAPALPTIAR